MNIKGRIRIFHGTIVAVAADNLASQLLGGFVQLGSATTKCRFCTAHKEDIQTKVRTYIIIINTLVGVK